MGVNPLTGRGAERSPAATIGLIAIVVALMAVLWIPIAARHLDAEPADD